MFVNYSGDIKSALRLRSILPTLASAPPPVRLWNTNRVCWRGSRKEKIYICIYSAKKIAYSIYLINVGQKLKSNSSTSVVYGEAKSITLETCFGLEARRP